MRTASLTRLLLPLFVLLFFYKPLSAGFLDSVVNKAKQATESVVDESLDKLTRDSAVSPAQSTQSKQSDQGTQTSTAAKQQNTEAAPASGLPEPTIGSMMLAAVHFRPNLLDNESTFKRVLLAVHPDKRPILSNEFQWRKQKDELKQQLLDEARSARLNFEMRPWRETSVTADRPIELHKYDFDRQAYRVGFATGTVNHFGIMIPGRSAPEPRYGELGWFAMPPERAEQIANRFGNTKRILYLGYSFQVTGALIETDQPIPVIALADDQFDLYQRHIQQQGNTMVPRYEHLGTVKAPLADPPQQVPIARQSPDPDAPQTSKVVRNAEIDGVKLGMSIGQALTALEQHGYEMETPGQPSTITGVTVEGRRTTADGTGWVNIMLRQIDGKVYQIKKDIGYLIERLPEGLTTATLHEQYQQELTAPFAGARYEYAQNNRAVRFDDMSPPPYNKRITSPHAQVRVAPPVQSHSGRWTAGVDLNWKDLVGADW